jgi:cysteine desulfurase
LLALGLDAQEAQQTIRLSLGRFTSEADIDHAAGLIRASIVQPAFWAVAQA